MKIGVIGLGQMGTGMARSLIRAGHAVTVYNRTADKVRALAEDGAVVASNLAEACRGDAVITMLADDPAVESLVLGREGVIASLPPGALHLSSSTISMAMARRLAMGHREARQAFVSAPVFGRPDVAAAGRLFVLVAGAPAAVDSAKVILEGIGRQWFFVSDRPEAANAVKLCGNFMIASAIEALGEALALVSKSGVEPRTFVEIMTSTLFDAPVYKTYGQLIADCQFEPAGFAALLGEKDIRLTLAAGESLRVPMPLGSLLRDRFLTLIAHGGERLDWSAIGRLPAVDAAVAERP